MASANEEKWEICDDEGLLIYKLKRCHLDLTVSVDGLTMAVEISDSEEKSWRDRKSKSLLKLKARYQGLIEQREILSSRMERASNFQERQQEWERDEAMKNFNEEGAFGSLMKEEIDEGLLKQHLINLPIWGSPHELMASLCEDQTQNYRMKSLSLIHGKSSKLVGHGIEESQRSEGLPCQTFLEIACPVATFVVICPNSSLLL